MKSPLPSLLQQLSAQMEAQLFTQQEAVLPFSDEERTVMAMSDFVSDGWRAHPQWRQELRQHPFQPDEWRYYQQQLVDFLQDVEDEASLMHFLRLFRRKMLIRIAWGQTLQLSSTTETLKQLTVLAEMLILAAERWLYHSCCQEWGTPVNAQGEQQPLLILAMGKLGGEELNFSSDVDLIFAYPEQGETEGGRRKLDNSQFFTRLGQRLIKVLSHPTVDGIVYRVDMRLRPFGESGPLVMSLTAMEDYYQEQGRDWERYAMIKGRLLGEESAYQQELVNLMRPFIYRKYIDFSVIQSLRQMQEMIAKEVRRRDIRDNIKLSAGGIREIEFIVQSFQLIRGGREPVLQQHQLLSALQGVSQLALLNPQQVTQLQQHYLFLRRLENLLQAIADEQTQLLPTGERDRSRIAWGMDFADWPGFVSALQGKMTQVRTIFDTLIGEEDEEEEDILLEPFTLLWSGACRLDQQESEYLPAEIENAAQLLQISGDFCRQLNKRSIGPRGRAVLDKLMPLLLYEVNQYQAVEQLLLRLLPLLLNIVTRTTYLELLIENRKALQQLVKLCAASSMISQQLACYPLLLDELIDPKTLYNPLPLTSYQDELRQYLLRIPEEDEEQQLEALRQFKQAQQLRIAAADISGALPVMQVSDHLTYLAEAIIVVVVQQAWKKMVSRYGLPEHLVGSERQGFAVVGYGKLGGWELGYGSDLDLVFLIDCPADAVTQGERVISGYQFYLRLAQRIIHLLSTQTLSGVLYAVDVRLRPSGESGLLVSTIEAFADYQRQSAWTWEHQALVRARVVYGESSLQQHFQTVRQQILCLPRDEAALRQEVKEMRSKMQQHHSATSELFDLKWDQGGIIDIEFLTQYLVLRYAAEYPKLAHWSDNVRILMMLAEYQVLEEQEAQNLQQAYITLRDEIHVLSLQECGCQVPAARFQSFRQVVQACWQRYLA